MCLLILKPSGIVYDHNFIKWSVNNGISFNRDGIGGAVRKQLSNTLMMNKGFFNNNVEYFYEWLLRADIKPEDELMIHLRQGTAGQKSTYNQHPYILGEDSTLNMMKEAVLTLESDNVETGVFAHNGIFWRDTYYDFDTKLSDSYNWAQTNFGTKSEINQLKTDPNILKTGTIASEIIGQKVCFMFPDREMIREGNFISDRGVLFSNQGYKNGNYNDRGGQHILSVDDDDEDSYLNYWTKSLSNSNLFLPATINNEEKPKVTETVNVITKDVSDEIKQIVDTNFSFTLDVVENNTNKPTIINLPRSNRNPKKITIDVTNFKASYKSVEDLDIPISINNDNKDHFILKAKKEMTKSGKLIPQGKKFFMYNCYNAVGSNIVHAISLKSTDIDDDSNYMTRYVELHNNFQIMPKIANFELYKDYMKLVELYGTNMSKNAKKKLIQLTKSVSIGSKPAIRREIGFYKTKYDARALLLFYENFYKQETPTITTRQLSLT